MNNSRNKYQWFLKKLANYLFDGSKEDTRNEVKTLKNTCEEGFESEVREVLKKVIDPELEINIVDLGLIYSVKKDTSGHIFVEMTLSTPACPIGDVIVQNVMETIQGAYPGNTVDVNLVFEPPWTPEMLTGSGKRALQGRM